MQNSRSHWSHREPRTISRLLLRMMIVLFVLCLLAQLSGCTTTRTVYVPVPVVPLPANLTAETPQPDLPDPFTWGASLDLNVALLSALAQCNRDKADIRIFENNRAGQTDGTIKR
ncbi:Rz1-like lysis system protein LysC [Escherichia coli]|uniref:Rz1-like lysis system protein LysC n=1 Tax=Escherichia coli TaxID=562 RepID=UPI003D8114A1